MAEGYQYDPANFVITDGMKSDFSKDGYILVKGLLSSKELKHIEHALTVGPFDDHLYGVEDGEGKAAHMILWSHPGNDVTGMVARCEKVAGTCEKVDNSAILACQEFTNLEGKLFYTAGKSETTRQGVFAIKTTDNS